MVVKATRGQNGISAQRRTAAPLIPGGPTYQFSQPLAYAGLTGGGVCWHLVSGMSVTIQVDLPDALVNEAKANGLLESRRLGELLNEELRRQRARKDLGQMLNELHSLPGEPMPAQEIQAEIDAVRAERRRRERRH